MAMPQLTKLVAFYRIKADAKRDDAGQVDESNPENWESIGRHRAEVAQVLSGESYGDDQVSTSAQYSITCRGDNLTRSITQADRIEHMAHGKIVRMNITSIRTVQDVPHVLEFVAEGS